MMPLEDRLRAALRAKADQVPPRAVPPLRLPARRRYSPSPAYGGGRRTGAPARGGWRGWIVPAASAVVIAMVAAGSAAVSHLLHGGQRPGRHQPAAAATRQRAAAWVATQVSSSAIVACDPVMCLALEAWGMRASNLFVVGPSTPDPLGSDVIVATAAVRDQFGGRLSSVYAPAVIASFGSGSAQIDIRVIAPDGAAAYRSGLSAGLMARRAAGTQLSRNNRIVVSGTARRQLLAGQVDSRLLTTIAAMSAMHPVSIVAFGDSGPGAGAGTPLRSVDLAESQNAPRTGRAAYMRQMLAFLHSQRDPYRAARAEILQLPSGRLELRVEFGAPSPLGVISPGAGPRS